MMNSVKRITASCMALFAIVSVSVLGVGLIKPVPPGGPLLDGTLERVRVGMAQAEVEAVVGPPRDAWNGSRFSISGELYRRRGYQSWIGRDSELLALYDQSGVVTDVQVVAAFSSRKPPNWVDRILTRIGF